MKLQIYTNFLKIIFGYFFHDKKVSKKSRRLFSHTFHRWKVCKDLRRRKCHRTGPFAPPVGPACARVVIAQH